jgi:caa(3)-type oxidase subunit IV
VSMKDPETGRERLVSRRTCLTVCVALLVLSGLSIALAQVSLRGWNNMLQLLIAGIQAVLIGQIYMRLRYTGGMPRLVSVAALFWFAILLAGTLDDVLTRGWLPIPGK